MKDCPPTLVRPRLLVATTSVLVKENTLVICAARIAILQRLVGRMKNSPETILVAKDRVKLLDTNNVPAGAQSALVTTLVWMVTIVRLVSKAMSSTGTATHCPLINWKVTRFAKV